MVSRIRNLILIALVGGCALLFSPEPRQAMAYDAYWNNYWSWYDNSYRPYYNRRYRNYYNNYGNYRRDFGFRYNPYPYSTNYGGYGGYYGNPYYNGYNSSYNGYNNGHALRGPHNSVDIGGLHFDWR